MINIFFLVLDRRFLCMHISILNLLPTLNQFYCCLIFPNSVHKLCKIVCLCDTTDRVLWVRFQAKKKAKPVKEALHIWVSLSQECYEIEYVRPLQDGTL